MNRAVVAIGVKKTGGLPELQAAVESAELFADWARNHQKVKPSLVKLITDRKGPVSRDRIFDTIDQLIKPGNLEQLIVYFSGHGINSGLFEQWLLSRAPDDPAAAVNLKGSEFGARFCGISHVVFISDACRTAADSIQAQRVVGADIFPNAKPSGAERPVDQFFATLVGNPAFEVKTVEESTSRFTAAFTKVLLEALQGKAPGLIETQDGAGFIRPRPLKRHLAMEVPIFFSRLNLPGKESSLPDARIESDPDAWLATLEAPALDIDAAAAGARAAAPKGVAAVAKGVVRAPAAALTPDEAPSADAPMSQRLTRGARGPRAGRADRRRAKAPAHLELPPIGVERRAAAAVDRSPERDAFFELRAALSPLGERKRGALAAVVAARRARGGGENRNRYDALLATGQTTFGPDHLESHCGLKVRGARIASAFARFARTEVETRDEVVQVTLDVGRKGANVLVALGDGSVVLAPAFEDFITGLSFDRQGNLEDVWCEPSANTQRWREYEQQAGEVRELRAVIAATTALGVFRLSETEDGAALLGRLRAVRTVDPALAVYAAHAWSDRRMRSQIVDLQRHLDADLGARIFDVAMLAFTLGKKERREGPQEMYPCVPMLTQGWALLSPLGIELPGGLGALRSELRPSLWTHFEADAADRLRNVLRQGKVG